jgi:hypothetical protein
MLPLQAWVGGLVAQGSWAFLWLAHEGFADVA